jgi:hypothetical protein
VRESLAISPLMFGLWHAPTTQGHCDTTLGDTRFTSSCMISCLRPLDEIVRMPFGASSDPYSRLEDILYSYLLYLIGTSYKTETKSRVTKSKC